MRVHCNPWCRSKSFCFHCHKCRVSCFVWINACPPITLALVFMSTSWYCVHHRWGLHFGCCHHHWSHLSRFTFPSYHLLGWGHDDGGSNKDGLYCDQHHDDVFFPFIIKVFGCLHQQNDNFLHQCAKMMWLTKGSRSPPLSILCSFYKHRVLKVLQKV